MKPVIKFDRQTVFADDPEHLWRVRAQGLRFVVLTRPGTDGLTMRTVVDLQENVRSKPTQWVDSDNVKYRVEIEQGQHPSLFENAVPLAIMPPRKTNKMITLRITAAEHALLSQQAVDANLSVNTYLLRQLGLTVPDDGTKPRGRKPKVAEEKA